MKVLKSAASPFARMVCVTAREAGVAIEEQDATTTPYATPAELAAANPLGKIPALIRNDGPTLFDSRVICRFLAAQGGANLYPETRIWDVLTLEALGQGLTEAAVNMVYERRTRAPEIQSEEWVEAQWTKIARSLDALEGQWMSLLTGPINAGQIACACGLAYLDFRLPERAWQNGHPALAKFAADFAERPSMQATKPE